MDISTWKKIDKALDRFVMAHIYIISFFITALMYTPYLLISEAYKYVYRKIRGYVYDPISKEWITKELMEERTHKRKIMDREIPLIVENHVHKDNDNCFAFFDKRKLKIPHDKLVYVETEYNEEIHQFFAENTEWLETWQRWHGWDIVEYAEEDIKEGMLYPQDYSFFKHGFLWNSASGGMESESRILCSTHIYYEIDVHSEIPIKKQMDDIMRKIYKTIDYT